MYGKHNVSWSIWLWKGKADLLSRRREADLVDIGYQGMVYVNQDTPYMRMLKPFIEKKKVCMYAE